MAYRRGSRRDKKKGHDRSSNSHSVSSSYSDLSMPYSSSAEWCTHNNVIAGATRRHPDNDGPRKQQQPAATSDVIRARVVRWAIGLDPAALNVNTTWTPGNTPRSRVRVETSYTITPYTTLLVGAP